MSSLSLGDCAFILEEVQDQLVRWRACQQQGLSLEAGLELAGIEVTAMLNAYDRSLVFKIYEEVADQRFAFVPSRAGAQLEDALDRLRPLLKS